MGLWFLWSWVRVGEMSVLRMMGMRTNNELTFRDDCLPASDTKTVTLQGSKKFIVLQVCLSSMCVMGSL